MLRLVRFEAALIAREPLALILVAMLAILTLFAVTNGVALMEAQVANRATAALEAADAREALAKRLAGPLSPEDAILIPARMRLPLIAPVPLLADFSVGRAGFEDHATTVGLRSKAETLFKRAGLGNPALLAMGTLDLGFVAVVVAPLVLIGLGAGLFAADRDSGAARLVLAQAGSPAGLLVARSLPRLALVGAPILLGTGALLLLGPDLPGRGTAALQWLLIVLALLAFWWAVILFVNSLPIGAETAALALVGLWVLLTLVVPPAIQTLASVAYPPPSRFAEIVASRAAEIAATTEWETDHPDLATDDVAGLLASLRKSSAIAAKIDAAVAPIAADFANQRAAQQALVARLAWLSPPLVTGSMLEDIAGTGPIAFGQFRAASASYLIDVKASLGALVQEGRGLRMDDLPGLPRFAWKPEPASPAPAILYLLALSAGLGLLARSGYRRPLIA